MARLKKQLKKKVLKKELVKDDVREVVREKSFREREISKLGKKWK